MKNTKNVLLLCLLMLTACLARAAERVTLYNDNGNGGIHRTEAKVVVDEGQYFVDLPLPAYGGRTETLHLKVERVKDSARLMYNQDRWAERYTYVVERPISFFQTQPYYFNMRSPWRPSLTDDPDDPYRVVPVRKLKVYYDDCQGSKAAMKAVLIKSQGRYMLYTGDDYFASNIESNATPPEFAPAWVRQYRYRSAISGITVYFNLN